MGRHQHGDLHLNQTCSMAKHDLKILRAVLFRCRRLFNGQQKPPSRHVMTRKPPPSPDNPDFVSIVDAPARIVSVGQKHSKIGLAILAVIPITAFCLGTWQIQRLDWKTKLIAKFEDRLVRPPLPLPPRVDPEAIHEFDYRRVYATGRLRHDKEMLIGPRMQDGKDGFMVITPLEREPWKKNMFTPANVPEQAKFYFPDVAQMAQVSGAEPIWIEETMKPDLLVSWDRESKGIPIGRAAEVNLRNNHFQYIFTWYSLSAATTLMMWMLLKKKPVDRSRRVRHVTNW